MDEGYEWLKGIADKMKRDLDKGAALDPERLTVRQLLNRFGYRKRGELITNHIRNGLESSKLHTSPDFASAWLDSYITIALDPDVVSDAPCTPTPRTSGPTLRIGALEAANKRPVSVKPDTSLIEAKTEMRMRRFSRLPVMQNERDIKGMVTWQHIGACGPECTHVRDCMERWAAVIPGDTRLLDAMRTISEHGYVLVQAKDKKVTGIVTATDVLQFFQDWAEPFVLIGEIEGHLRNLIYRKFTREQLQAASEETIEGYADLTLGGYIRLLENRANWERLGLDHHREAFIRRLRSVKDIRNGVMHFNSDLDEDDRKEIRDAARFFDELARTAASPPPAEPDARPLPPSTPSGTDAEAAPPPASSKPRKSRTPVRVVILGKEHESRNAMEATIRVLRELAERDPSFLERCSRHEQAKGRRLRYIARTPEELYPDGDEDRRARHAELPGGWLIGTNMNKDGKSKILRMAAEVAGLTYGKDFVVDDL